MQAYHDSAWLVFSTPDLLFFFFFWMSLGFELRASNLLGSAISLELCPQLFFALVIFQVGSHIFAMVASDHDPLTYLWTPT
jgi:hypothetical protein